MGIKLAVNCSLLLLTQTPQTHRHSIKWIRPELVQSRPHHTN